MAFPELDDPQQARQYALALTEILRSSGWYDPVSFQDAAYNWSATRLPLEVIKQYLAAGIADAWVANECFRDFGISAEQIQAAGVGERITIGTMSLEDAAKVILGPRAAGGLDQLWEVVSKERGFLLPKDLRGQARLDLRREKDKEGRRWWDARAGHLGGFLDDDPPVPPELAPWVGEQSDDVLLGIRDAAIPWARPLTIAVAQLDLERFEQMRRDLGLGPDDWQAEVEVAVSGHLHTLVMGSFATRELTRRLGKRVEAAIVSPPEYVTAMLGPIRMASWHN